MRARKGDRRGEITPVAKDPISENAAGGGDRKYNQREPERTPELVGAIFRFGRGRWLVQVKDRFIDVTTRQLHAGPRRLSGFAARFTAAADYMSGIKDEDWRRLVNQRHASERATERGG